MNSPICQPHRTQGLAPEPLELRCGLRSFRVPCAGVAELADALDSKSSDRKIVWVRSPPPAVRAKRGLLNRLRNRARRIVSGLRSTRQQLAMRFLRRERGWIGECATNGSRNRDSICRTV